MWFDLSMIGTGFSNAMHFLPFANAVDVINFATAGLWNKVWLPLAITCIWAVVLFALAVVTFSKKSKK
ncbi:MAG: ABC transporter permease, partial [Clostridia bacterium]|nr:ABC transporter permease [Clostridia bacterium]